MMVTIGFTFALGVLFPVLMDSFRETREKTGEFYVIRLKPRKLRLLENLNEV